jgi:hypothetical protein
LLSPLNLSWCPFIPPVPSKPTKEGSILGIYVAALLDGMESSAGWGSHADDVE